MPKQRVTKEMLLDAALALVEEKGHRAVTVIAVSNRAGCSPQPVYSSWRNMEGMWQELHRMISAKVQTLAAEYIDPDDPFRSTGHAFAMVATEHPNLFHAFAAARRPQIGSLDELLEMESDPEVTRRLADRLHVTPDEARQLHLHMLIYNAGLCTIYSACSPEMPPSEIFDRLDTAYEAFESHVCRDRA